MKLDITSLQNPKVKHIVKLRDDKRQRQRDGLMLVEGLDELSMALASGLRPRTIFSAPELVSKTIDIAPTELLTVGRSVFEKISYRENPDGWLAIFPIPKTPLEKIRLSANPLVVIAESLEKPGNLGAILRTADAAGVDAVIACNPRVDVWNPNVVRASRGAIFAVSVVESRNAEALTWIRSSGMRIAAATPSADTLYTKADLRAPFALAVGTEDLGLTDFWLTHADFTVKIPMSGMVNSLNVSTATAIIIFETLRQRNPE
jgi:TrmH family RNA methyltransferase